MIKSIKIELNSVDEIYNIYNKEFLNEELRNYLNQAITPVSIKQDIEFQIVTKEELSKEEQEKISKAIRRHYGLQVQGRLILKKYIRFKYFFVFSLGILLIALSNIVKQYIDTIVPEVILIAGWVAIWEVVNQILFREGREQMTLKRYKQLTTAKITFISK